MPYHHGHLREALVDAALATARVDGPGAVGLRAATRAAGVSPNAAYRHFADHDQLLQAVADRCMDQLAGLMDQRLGELPAEPDPVLRAWQRLRVAGESYVEFALTETGWFRTAFRAPRRADEPWPSDLRNPYVTLSTLLDELVAAGALPADRRPGAEYGAWAAVHGISTLLVDGPLSDLPAAERTAAVAKAIEMVQTGL